VPAPLGPTVADMDDLKSLVERARRGDLDAYGLIVARPQDMAFGYAYSLTGDFHLAEDATQEAFLADVRANAALYGMDEPADSFMGVPQEFIMGPEYRVFEIRDLSRRLQISPFDIARWTNDGMPSLRHSPWVRWDVELTTAWIADTNALPADRYTPQQLDHLENFLLAAVATGRQGPDLACQILQGWAGLV